MNKFTCIIPACALAFTLSCERKDIGDMEERDCAAVNCTYQLVWLGVSVVDASGKPVALDRMKVTRVSDGKDLTHAYEGNGWSVARNSGEYVLSGDVYWRDIPRFKRTRLRFQGHVGNRQVVNAEYVVTFDCCHICLVSGEPTLIVK